MPHLDDRRRLCLETIQSRNLQSEAKRALRLIQVKLELSLRDKE